MTAREPSPLIKLVKYIRDARLVWDVMGSVYNRRIYEAITELYDRIVRELEMRGPARILDAGAGQGYISVMLASKNPELQMTGIDYSLMQVREAEKYRVQRKIVNCSFQQGNVMDIRFPDETFDAAVSVGSIKHWPDALRGLAEIRRVLKPGGRLIVSETDQGASDDAVRQFIRRFQIWFIPDRLLFWGLRHVIFGQSYSETTLAAAIRKAGFRDVECQRVPTCPYIIVKARK
jgi:ubiquinone/menaquinone biosynthesis C-methylase UbiE